MVVTISREYGAAGLAVSHGTAAALGYGLLTEELPRTVAARLGTSADEVAARASSDMPLSERILSGLGAAMPEATADAGTTSAADFDGAVRREIEQTVRERAAGGNVVILGRGANAILAGTPGLLRVFLTAPRAWRVTNLARTFGSTPDEAAADLERIDAARRKIAKERYGITFGDPHAYDVVLDTSRFGIEGAVAVVVAATRAAETR